MSQILDFYRLEKPDSEGRMLSDMWEWDNEELEHCHDFIQWMFPLDEPSAFNAEAQLLSEEDRAEFRTEPQLQAALRRSFSVFLGFLGLMIAEEDQVVTAESFTSRHAAWRYPNHNWLRITRVLKSLRLLGLESEAAALWLCLKDLHENRGLVS